MTPAWPLSAPATALLLSLRTSKGELLRLGIRHLVVVGAWRLEAGPLRAKILGWQSKREVRLLATTRSGPASLALLDSALRSGLPHAKSDQARHVVQGALAACNRLVSLERDAAISELIRAGLVSEQPRSLGLGTRRALTPTGRAWRASIPSTHAAWQRDLRAGGEAARAAVSSAARAPGLLLVADPSLLADLDRELRRDDRFDLGEGIGEVHLEDLFDGLLNGCGDLLDGLKGLGDLDFGVSDSGGSGGDGGDGGGGGD